MTAKPVSISVYTEPALLKKIDSLRGDVKRSTFIVRILKEALGE